MIQMNEKKLKDELQEIIRREIPDAPGMIVDLRIRIKFDFEKNTYECSLVNSCHSSLDGNPLDND